MKILIYGAGVIGSIYAAKLFDAKNDVALLARGKRLQSLQQYGVIIRDQITGEKINARIPLKQQLDKSDFYDLIIVTVRLDQVESVLPALKNNSGSPLIMFMLNNPESIKEIADELKTKHVIFGFPGVGGTLKDDVIEFIQIKQQKTTIGEINGRKSVTIKKIKFLFEKSGLEVDISDNIDAWLKTHAVFISCISASILHENGSSIQLGKNKRSIQLMVKSIKEGFNALKDLGIPITPFNLKIIFLMMPGWFSVMYWQKAMQSEMGTLAIAPHVNSAKNELQLLAEKVLEMVHSSSKPTPLSDSLLSKFINADKESIFNVNK